MHPHCLKPPNMMYTFNLVGVRIFEYATVAANFSFAWVWSFQVLLQLSCIAGKFMHILANSRHECSQIRPVSILFYNRTLLHGLKVRNPHFGASFGRKCIWTLPQFCARALQLSFKLSSINDWHSSFFKDYLTVRYLWKSSQVAGFQSFFLFSTMPSA